MQDYLSVISSTSQIFETKNLLLLKTPQSTEDTIIRLEIIQPEHGESNFINGAKEYQPVSSALTPKIKGGSTVSIH